MENEASFTSQQWYFTFGSLKYDEQIVRITSESSKRIEKTRNREKERGFIERRRINATKNIRTIYIEYTGRIKCIERLLYDTILEEDKMS
jgi:hypothetical protein